MRGTDAVMRADDATRVCAAVPVARRLSFKSLNDLVVAVVPPCGVGAVGATLVFRGGGVCRIESCLCHVDRECYFTRL